MNLIFRNKLEKAVYPNTCHGKGDSILLSALFSGSPLQILYTFLALAIVLFTGIPFHEFAHGWTAERFGDRTARLSGRLTVNPFAHFDLFGTLMLFLVGVGFAKPVPINPNNFRGNKKVGIAVTALAGPLSNLIIAFLFVVLGRLVNLLYLLIGGDLAFYYIFIQVLFLAAQVNVGLATFNLIPLPPLDGWRILGLVLPAKWQFFAMKYQYYIVLLLFVLLATDILSTPLGIAQQWVLNLFSAITEPIATGFGLLV